MDQKFEKNIQFKFTLPIAWEITPSYKIGPTVPVIACFRLSLTPLRFVPAHSWSPVAGLRDTACAGTPETRCAYCENTFRPPAGIIGGCQMYRWVTRDGLRAVKVGSIKKIQEWTCETASHSSRQSPPLTAREGVRGKALEGTRTARPGAQPIFSGRGRRDLRTNAEPPQNKAIT